PRSPLFPYTTLFRSAESMSGLELRVAGNGLDQVLAIVEHAFDREVENVRVGERVHLCRLERAHPALRREHEYLDPPLAAQRVFRSEEHTSELQSRFD